MKMFIGKRGSGKTTKSIAIAYAHDALLITNNNEQAKYIKRRAEQMGMNIEAIGIKKYLEAIEKGLYFGKPVVIDEVDYVLTHLFHGDILGCTASCELEILQNGANECD